MLATDYCFTPTGIVVLATMVRCKERGVNGLTRRKLAQCARADKSTVHAMLRGFIQVDWVNPSRSVDPETGVPNATVYRLTESAPTLDELLAIEAVV